MKKLIIVLCSVIFCACSDDDNLNGSTSLDVSFFDFTDKRDSVVYKCMTIGDQTWMVENLKYRIQGGGFDGCYTANEDGVAFSDLVLDLNVFADSIQAAKDAGKIVNPEGLDPLPPMGTPLDNIIFYFQMGLSTTVVYDLVKSNGWLDIYDGLLLIEEKALLASLPAVAAVKLKEAEAGNGHYSQTYGFLYTYNAAQKAVPEGWRVPTDEDWKKLEMSLGMNAGETDRMEEWRGSDQGALLKEKTGGIGFDAQLGGVRVYGATPYGKPYYDQEAYGCYWSASRFAQTDTTNLGIVRKFFVYSDQIFRGTSNLTAAYSVRCIKK